MHFGITGEIDDTCGVAVFACRTTDAAQPPGKKPTPFALLAFIQLCLVPLILLAMVHLVSFLLDLEGQGNTDWRLPLNILFGVMLVCAPLLLLSAFACAFAGLRAGRQRITNALLLLVSLAGGVVMALVYLH